MVLKRVPGSKNSYMTRQSATTVPGEAEIVFYLDEYDEDQLKAVQAAAIKLGYELGYTDFVQTDEETGSIFRRFRGKLKTGIASDFVQQKLNELDERARIEIYGRAQAETTSMTASVEPSVPRSGYLRPR